MQHNRNVRHLFKTILKLHRGLPVELRLLGDNYVKDEFKRHKNCTIEEAKMFMTEWSTYALNLAEQLGLGGPKYAKQLGVSLTIEDLDKFRAEQIQQLYELKLATKSEDT